MEKVTSADCYSDSERELMERTQAWRARLFRPLLALLTRLKFRADHITLLSGLAGLCFVPLLFLAPMWSVAALALHVFLDGFDGPLARFQKCASPKGSFTDTMTDQLVLCAVVISLMVAGYLSIVTGTIFVIAYTVVVLFAIARNALEIPYTWLVRPRFVLFIAIVFGISLSPMILEIVTALAAALLSLKVLSGFWKLRAQL